MNKFKECNQCPHEFNDKNLEPCKDCVPKKKTNADRIRAMSDEELAELITSGELCAICPMCDFYGKDLCYIENDNTEKNFSKGILSWLQSEAEEPHD